MQQLVQIAGCHLLPIGSPPLVHSELSSLDVCRQNSQVKSSERLVIVQIARHVSRSMARV